MAMEDIKCSESRSSSPEFPEPGDRSLLNNSAVSASSDIVLLEDVAAGGIGSPRNTPVIFTPTQGSASKSKRLRTLTPAQQKAMEARKLKNEEEARLRKEKRDEDSRLKKEAKEKDRQEKKAAQMMEKQKKEEEKREADRLEKEKRDKEKEEARRRKEDEDRPKKEEKLAKERVAQEEAEKQQKVLERQQKFFASFLKKIPKKEPVHLEGSVNFSIFLPYEIQEGVRVAPRLRVQPLTPSKLGAVDEALSSESRKFPATYPRNERSKGIKSVEIFVDNNDELEMEMDSIADEKPLKPKLLHFHDNARPPYYGTMSKRSTIIRPRNPFAHDSDIDYDIDSDEEWEEEQAILKEGEIDDCSEEEMSEEEKDDEEEDDFFENDEREPVNAEDLVDGRKRFRTAKEKFLHRTLKKRAKRRIVGPFWGDEEEQCPISLKDLAVIHLAQDFDEVMDHAEVHEDLGEAVNKIPAAIMPYLIKIVHGSTARKELIARAFLNLWDIKENPAELQQYGILGNGVLDIFRSVERPKHLSKSLVVTVISNISAWQRPPVTEISTKKCHYVMEKIRGMYKILEGPCLPNPACCKVEKSDKSGKNEAEKRKLDSSISASPESAAKQLKMELDPVVALLSIQSCENGPAPGCQKAGLVRGHIDLSMSSSFEVSAKLSRVALTTKPKLKRIETFFTPVVHKREEVEMLIEDDMKIA